MRIRDDLVVGSRSQNRVSGSDKRCQMITAMYRPTARIAFFFHVSERPVDTVPTKDRGRFGSR